MSVLSRTGPPQEPKCSSAPRLPGYFSLPDTPEQLMDEWSQMAREMYHHHVQLKPGALRLLEALQYTLTNLSRENFNPAALERLRAELRSGQTTNQ